MKQRKEYPQEINNVVNELSRKYSASPATTEAGRILRFIVKFVPVDTLLKALVHKVK